MMRHEMFCAAVLSRVHGGGVVTANKRMDHIMSNKPHITNNKLLEISYVLKYYYY